MTAQSQNPALRLGAYMRVSRMGTRQAGAEDFHSTDFAREDVVAWADANGHTIVRHFEDLNQSGGKFDRPAFQEVLAAMEAGEIDGLVVPYLSRFARSMSVAYQALKVIEQAGGVFISVEEGLVLRTPNDWLNFNMRMSFHEWDLKMKTDAWARLHAARIADGKPMTVPFGYRRGGDEKLEIHPVEAEWVRTIFALRLEGRGTRAIAQHLTDNGAPTPKGKAKCWTGAGIGRVLARRTYLGEVKHGKNVKKNAHPAIVDDLTFTRAGLVRGKPITKSETHLLSGLVRCAGCRGTLKAQHTTRGSGIFYACRGESGAGACPAPAWVMEEDVLALLRQDYVRILNGQGGFVFKAVSENPRLAAVRTEVEILRSRYDAHWRDEDMKALDRAQWMVVAKDYKKELEEKEAEEKVLLRAALSDTASPDQGFQWPADKGGQRTILTETFTTVFLRGHSDRGDVEHRSFVRGFPVPELPKRGKVNDLGPIAWDRNEPQTWVALG